MCKARLKKTGSELISLHSGSQLFGSFYAMVLNKKKVRETEGQLPFSVRLRNDNFRLRNLLNPPQVESSLLGEPGIMLV